jgi:hypothetical protein
MIGRFQGEQRYRIYEKLHLIPCIQASTFNGSTGDLLPARGRSAVVRLGNPSPTLPFTDGDGSAADGLGEFSDGEQFDVLAIDAEDLAPCPIEFFFGQRPGLGGLPILGEGLAGEIRDITEEIQNGIRHR